MKILVVDDSRTMRKIIRNALESMGYSPDSVLEAGDGVAAMAILTDGDRRIDIVLADWNMPQKDGLSMLQEMQASDRLSHIPFIMVTGEAQRDRVVEAIRAGARNYVVKPFTPETLRQKVLTIEMELLARRKPSDTAVMRMNLAKVREKPGTELPFVAQLPEELVAGIYEAGHASEHAAGEVLIEPGDSIDHLYLIDRGEVEVDCKVGGGSPETRRRGECVGEIPFLSGDRSELCATAREDTTLLSVDKDSFENLLAEYPHLSFYLTRLLAKRATQRSGDVAHSLSGRLTMMTLAELVQSLHNTRKTGVLKLSNGVDEGRISFESGDVRNAVLNGKSGEEAFYQLVTWADGSFEFVTGETGMEPSIYMETMGLLMEGMRRQDELRQMRA